MPNWNGMERGGQREASEFLYFFPLLYLCIYIHTYIRTNAANCSQSRNAETHPSIHPCTYLHTYLPGNHHPPQPSLLSPPSNTAQWKNLSKQVNIPTARCILRHTVLNLKVSKPTPLFFPIPSTNPRKGKRGGRGGGRLSGRERCEKRIFFPLLE